jgi:protein involved in polysaccharide export with SLBB domain
MVEWFVKAVPENPTSRRKLLISAGAGVAAVAVIGSLWSNATSGSGEVAIQPSAQAQVNPQSSVTLFVQVVGAVVEPGVYEVPMDSRVMDAVALAGGLSSNADPASLNLARIVQDGEQIIVGAVGDARSRRSTNSSSDKSWSRNWTRVTPPAIAWRTVSTTSSGPPHWAVSVTR